MTLALIREHRLAQINNGTLAAALLLELAAEFEAGRATRSEFIDALVGADLLSHQAAVRLAAAFVRDMRAANGVGGVIAESVFDVGASYGRAVGLLRDLDDARGAAASTKLDRDYAAEFWRIVEADAVRADRVAKNAGRETVIASAEASGRSWRRVSDGKPCTFCGMLVGRGPVYRSEAAAGGVGRGRDVSTNFRADGTRKRGGQAKGVKARGGRRLGAGVHDSCGCAVVEQIGTWTPTAEEQRYRDLYEANAGGDAHKVLARMRADPNAQGVFNDAHPTPQT